MGVRRGAVVAEVLQFIADAPLDWRRFSGKTVLVTGAGGFLPAYLVETLLYLNETVLTTQPLKVIALVRDLPRAHVRYAHHEGRKDLVLIAHDVATPLSLEGDIHFIIHAASQASPKYFGTDPIGTLRANVLGTSYLLELAHEKHVESFLFFSTSEVYGNVLGGDAPIHENEFGALNPVVLRSCYAEGKRAGEALCAAWHHQHGVPACIVRPFHVYGGGVSLDDGRVFADFVANILNNQNIVMKSDGTAVRSFCYVADATVAFFTALLNGQAGEAYNVGDANGVIMIRDLAHLLVSLFPEKNLRVVVQPIRTDAYIKSEFKLLVPDLTKIGALGWKAKHSLGEGFRRTVRYYAESTPNVQS